MSLSVGAAVGLQVFVTADPSRITTSRSTHIFATVVDGSGNPMPNVGVIFRVDTNTEFMDSQGHPIFTDNNGRAEDVLRTRRSSSGSVTVTATTLDGASGWQIFRFMTLPHLRQYLELAILLGSVYVVQTFDHVFTITQGGPGSATTNLPYEIYLTTFRKYEYGEAAAAGVVTVIGTIILATFALRLISSLFDEEVTR